MDGWMYGYISVCMSGGVVYVCYYMCVSNVCTKWFSDCMYA